MYLNRFFYRILKQILSVGLAAPSIYLCIFTHVKVSANKHTFHKKIIQKEAPLARRGDAMLKENERSHLLILSIR